MSGERQVPAQNDQAHCPADCPVPGGERCELLTVSTSQVASALVVLFTLVWFATSAIPNGNDPWLLFSYQALVVLVATIMYYYVGVWVLEEAHFLVLRRLRPHYVWIETVLRLLILVGIGTASSSLGGLHSGVFGLPPLATGLMLLVVVFLLFLIWDAIVALGDDGSGDQFRLAWRFFKTDIAGAAVGLLCLGSFAFRATGIGAFAIILAVVFVIWALAQNGTYFGSLVSRLGDRERWR